MHLPSIEVRSCSDFVELILLKLSYILTIGYYSFQARDIVTDNCFEISSTVKKVKSMQIHRSSHWLLKWMNLQGNLTSEHSH